jgi:hypothetical protein
MSPLATPAADLFGKCFNVTITFPEPASPVVKVKVKPIGFPLTSKSV